MYNSKDIQLIEDSWDYILLNTQEAGFLFYEHLFTKYPETRMLFRTDINDQARKIVAMITFAVNKLHDFDSIVSDIESLGLRHGNYGVTPEHYQMVGESLLAMLEKGMGPKWNEDLKMAWTNLFKHLAEVMINASQNHLAIRN